MNYPLISEYIEAIRSAEDNFATLTNLRPIMDEDRNPIMMSGNFAVVFKMKDTANGNLYAVKCFLKDQPNRAESYKLIADELENVSSTFLVQFRFLDKELFVDTNNSEDDEFPVLIMDWVEGVTLDKHIRKNIDNQYVLQMLAFQFTKLAMWIIPQPFAHGDIKPDNVMVREDGSLVLIDYDGMYVPAMNGQKARELGSPDFRHPYRTVDNFTEHIDDFSLVSILLSLYVIANDSSLLVKYGAADRLLLSEKDYHNISACKLLKEIYPSTDNKINILISLFNIAIINEDISTLALDLLKRVEKLFVKEIDTICSIKLEDLDGYKVDKFGVIYSYDYKILLKVPSDIKVYNVKEGTEIIANGAFDWFDVAADSESVDFFYADLEQIYFPHSIRYITASAFGEDGHKLKEIRVSSSIYYFKSLLGNFSDKVILRSAYDNNISNSDSFYDISGAEYSKDGTLLLSLDRLSPDNQSYSIRSGVKTIKFGAAQLAKSIRTIIIPEGVENIEGSAFYNSSLSAVNLPQSLKTIGIGAFEGCENLQKIDIPEEVKAIKDSTFAGCSNLKEISIPQYLKSIGYNAFCGCKSLQHIIIPDSIESIESRAFNDCDSLSIYIYSRTYKRLRDFLDYENIIIYFKDEKGLPEYGGGKWIPKSIRHFVKDELDFIVKADVVASQYGLSVSFLRRDGITSYIPLFEYSNLVVGDRIYMKKAKLLTLRRSGYNDIFRIVL